VRRFRQGHGPVLAARSLSGRCSRRVSPLDPVRSVAKGGFPAAYQSLCSVARGGQMSLSQRDTPPQEAILSAQLRELLKICLVIGIAIVHYFYACYVGYYLFEKVGGVQTRGSWTGYGGVDFAWTIPIHLPGTIAMAIAREYHQRPGDVFAVFAFCLFLAGSLLTSYVIASLAMNLMNREKINFGCYGWRAAVVVLGMSWIPVPVTWSWVYNVTVLF
jgi:hypothetical protein